MKSAPERGARRPRVCLLTPAHLAASPRLVKEARALCAAGYRVTTVSCDYLEWAAPFDRAVLEDAPWRAARLCWRRGAAPLRFWRTRLRQHAARAALRALGAARAPQALRWRAYARIMPELLRMALREPADLYIGHDLAALPVAVTAARRRGARAGFDAEDLHSGMAPAGTAGDLEQDLARRIEAQWLPRCDYLSAASPGIARAYAQDYGVPAPTPILNVFPRSEAPAGPPAHHAAGPLRLYWCSQTIGARRGLEEVVAAMGALRGHDIRLSLRGRWQAGFRETLQRLAARHGVRERITALPWAPAAELARLAAQHDVGLALESPESRNRDLCLTNKLFTYLLAGNAVLATETTAQRELAAELGAAVRYCAPRDAESTARALREWCRDREALRRARAAGYRLGQQRFNWEHEQQRFLALVRGVLG